jgi:hypothetical protein
MLIKILDSYKRNLPTKELIKDRQINDLLSLFNKEPFVIRALIDKFISEYEIGSYRDNDIFFAAMRLFFDYLTKEDISSIWKKCKDNEQTHPPYGGLLKFMYDVSKRKPSFISQEIREWITIPDFKEYLNELENGNNI